MNIKIERLAELKAAIKGLEEEAKGLQKELIAEGAGEKLQTPYGTLTLTTRTTMECADKQEAVKRLGFDRYVKASKLSHSDVKKEFGNETAEHFKDIGIFKVKSVSQYYTLRK